MPTELTLFYTTYSTITLPNNIARKLKEAQRDPENAQSFDPKKPWTFGNKWGNIFYTDDAGVEHEYQGELYDLDFKRADRCEWGEEEVEDDEVVMTAENEDWEEIYNNTGDMPGVAKEYEWEPGTFYQTSPNGGGPGGARGYWVRTGGNAVWKVEGHNFHFISGAILEVGFKKCRLRLLIK